MMLKITVEVTPDAGWYSLSDPHRAEATLSIDVPSNVVGISVGATVDNMVENVIEDKARKEREAATNEEHQD